MNRRRLTLTLMLLVTLGLNAASSRGQRQTQVIPGAQPDRQPIPTTPRILPNNPLRLGGVYTSGLGGGPALASLHGVSNRLSAENREWIARNCDVIALSPTDIDLDTFPAINKVQTLFTPLLYLYASTLYETEHRGSVGGWRPEMRDWVLQRADGSEAPYPERGGHWMDFANLNWAAFWTARLDALTRQYGAFGAAVAELPLGNTFAGSDLLKYHSAMDRAAATKTWLEIVRKGYRNLIIPSATGFDLAAGHATPDTGTLFAEPALPMRLWNDFYPITDGAWCEGWVQPYWDRLPLSESLWETQMEAADRAGRLGQVFVAAPAYRNDGELEFALASYLLIVHNQGRVVFQPMPIRPGEPNDAGFSLAVLRREVQARPRYFRIPLGRGMQERHQIPVEGGAVWRRNFQFGDVYVNSDERRTVSVLFAGSMRRLTGTLVRRVDLPPHTGAVLLYASDMSGSKTAHRKASGPERARHPPIAPR